MCNRVTRDLATCYAIYVFEECRSKDRTLTIATRYVIHVYRFSNSAASCFAKPPAVVRVRTRGKIANLLRSLSSLSVDWFFHIPSYDERSFAGR